ncbi:U6 snRNA-associated Sm-like protein LSm7 isoform X2 [Narcine bancroftii]|uniref:U6 snRNA-associated Sm-like protein LSm7 isoform X2 n=1 Tax=Narcine bancroftii TaxID=1343680 RepID=UPI00383151A9
MADKEKKKKESILDLSKYIDKTIRVKFQGGREASGILKGFDPLLNLVLDGTIEYVRGCFPFSACKFDVTVAGGTSAPLDLPYSALEDGSRLSSA